jgi:o-succinylbenzoate synthase
MKIIEATYFPFSLKLKTPFVNSIGTLRQRNGFILKLTDEFGNIGYGECSPLPAFSKESLTEAEENLSNITTGLLQYSYADELSFPSELPSVSYAVEQALLDLAFAQKKDLLTKKLGLVDSVINVNAVIGFDDYQNIFNKIKNKIELGYKTFKIKVGRDNPYEDYELLETIRVNFGFDFKIRLDVNQKWSADEAIEYLERFKAFEIEYVEEPCEFASSTLRTFEETHIPVALDESIKSSSELMSLLTDLNTEYLVVKPMIIGGFFTIKNIIDLANQNDKKIIISSSFESAIGKRALVMLASLTNHSLAHGLDTTEFFENDISPDVYPVTNGKINFINNILPHKTDLSLQ